MSNIAALLTKIDLTDLAERAGAHFDHRAGHDIRSTCPLHGGDNRTAFSVYQNGSEFAHWHCYTTCQAGGDAIDFYMAWKRLAFTDAVRDLAALYHVSLEDIGFGKPVDIQAEHKRRAQQDILTAAADIFMARLWSPEGQAARDYLMRRSFTAETIEALGWGYTTSDNSLAECLALLNADLETARETGLIRADGRDFTANKNGAHAAPFGWIVFPHPLGERVTYYSARAVETDQPRPDPSDKSRNLPGHRQVYRCELHTSIPDVTLVEGPLDAATLYQAGKSAWGLCGLGSLPEDDLIRLRRRPVYLATDGDNAGQQALTSIDSKLAKSATAIGPLTKILPPLSAGKDFNAWLQAGLDIDQLNDLYAKARTWLEFRMRLAADCTDNDYETRMLEIGALLAAVPEASQPRYFRLAHDLLGLTRRDIQALIRQAVQQESNNILASIKDGQLCFASRPLMNGVINITHELVIDDGQDMPTVQYTVTGKLATGQPLEPLNVPAEEFADFKWIPRHWGRAPVLYVARGQYYELGRAVQEVSDKAVRERVYTYTGWTTIESQRCYLSASGAIGGQGLNPAVRVDLGMNNLRHYAMPETPTLDNLWTAVQASLDFIKVGPRAVTAPLWAAMYAAPLTEIMPLYAVLWVYGQTQSGKSTIVHLALTHFGSRFVQGRQYHAPIDWTSTATAIEGAMFTVKDAPLLIDDFAPQFASAADSRDMHRKAHLVIRSVGNRSSRGRARADLTQRRERVPRGLVIATAENPLMGQGIVGRMIYVPVGRGDIVPLDGKVNPELDRAQECGERGLYSQAMAGYLQWLAANYERIAAALPARINAAAVVARAAHPTIQGRLPDYYAMLSVAQQIALESFCDLGVISQHELQRESEANSQAILAVISQQAERIATESPVRKVFDALGSLLSGRKIYLAQRLGGDYVPPLYADQIGWFDDKKGDTDYVYLDTKQCLISARSYWAELNENLDILPDAFLLQTRQIPGLIAKPGEQGREEASVYIAGKTRRVLVLSRQKILQLYGVDLSNESLVVTQQEAD